VAFDVKIQLLMRACQLRGPLKTNDAESRTANLTP
jgi:hypothetical protein